MAVKAGERNVSDTPQNRQLNAAWYAMELAVYTLDICKNKNIFLPEYQTFLTDKIVQTALDILGKQCRQGKFIQSKTKNKKIPETIERR